MLQISEIFFTALTHEKYYQHEKVLLVSHIPKWPCNVLFIIQILMKCPDEKHLVLFIFEMIKKCSPTNATCMLCNMKQDMKIMKNKSMIISNYAIKMLM